MILVSDLTDTIWGYHSLYRIINETITRNNFFSIIFPENVFAYEKQQENASFRWRWKVTFKKNSIFLRNQATRKILLDFIL